MRLCRHCGERLPQQATSCPVCTPKRKKKKQQARPEEPQITLKALKDPSVKPKPAARAEQAKVTDPKTKTCPECGEAVPKASKFCFSCGLIFFTTPAKPERVVVSQEPEKKNPYLKKVVFFSFLFVVTALGFQVFHSNPPAVSNVEESLSVFPIDDGVFDRTLQLPSHRSGVAWNGNEFVFITNSQPPEFLRVTPEDNGYHFRRIPTPDLRQRGMAVLALTWNGKQYVGYAESGLFSASKEHLFTIHDPETLELQDTHSAPENIGGLAWDGAGYWAASRNTDPESNEEAYLYRLDQNFKVINKLKSITNDCRGLAWDGEFLWYVDGARARVYVLNVKGVTINTVRVHKTNMDSLSGVAFDGQAAWVIEEQRNRFYRLLPDYKLRVKTSDTLTPAFETAEVDNPASDRYAGTTKYPSNDVEVNEFYTQVANDELVVSWKIHVGEDLFETASFATLAVVVQSSNLQRPITKIFEVQPGSNQADSELIAENLPQGSYQVGLMLYLQYKDPTLGNRILTRSVRTLRVTN